MHISRYERECEHTAGPRLARLLFVAYGVAALVGLAIGIVWTIAGLLHFHPLW
jgi:hypothetical protein